MTAILFFDGGGPLDVEFIQTSIDAFTTVSVNFGSAAAGRKIICAVHVVALSAANPNVTAATIGGVAASIFTGAVHTPGNPATAGDLGTWWIGAEVPTGTSGNVTVTLSGGSSSFRLGVWRMVNAINLAPTDFAAANEPGTPGTHTVNADVSAGGVFFGAATAYHASGISLSGIATDYNDNIGGGRRAVGGFQILTSAEANRALTLANSGGTNMAGTMAAVSFR